MKIIYTRKGEEILVDDKDYEKYKIYCFKIDIRGYAARKCGGKLIRLHREIIEGSDGKLLDHINGNILDNQKSNLRFCSAAQNCQNRTVNSKNNTSGYKGVSWRKDKKKWQASIQNNRNKIHLGYFINKKEAAKSYNKKAKELFGNFCRINII